ncbi:MAG: helicase C-terminal domain-containing protein [Planctomycetota bacterium]
MAQAVKSALAERRILLVEAGTGVGKSFAYLLPSALWAKETGERVIISTHTINLQEQLIGKDIPFIRDELGIDIKAFLAKGRNNYVCLRRLLHATSRHSEMLSLFKTEDFETLDRIERWIYTDTGCDHTRSTLNFYVEPHVWNSIKVEAEACPGKKCRYFNSCRYMKDRQEWETTDLLVVNHSMFFVDVALKANDVPFLPGHGAVVFDEAHSLEDAATDHIGVNLRRSECLMKLRKLYDVETDKGLLAFSEFSRLQSMTIELTEALKKWFSQLSDFREEKGSRLREPGRFEPLPGKMGEIYVQELAAAIRTLPEESDLFLESYSAFSRVREIVAGIHIFVNHSAECNVYWVEGDPNDAIARVAPIRVGNYLRNYVWDSGRPYVLASATLATNRREGCRYLRERLGIEQADELILGSPFNYREQVTMCVPKDMPDPRDTRNYQDSLLRYIGHFVRKSKGRAFVLFTNIADMKRCARELRREFEEEGFMVLVQGDGMGRTRMLEAFKEHGQAVLFGVNSFWQGVDVRGEALSNVIITKLPFDVPDDPVVEARREEIALRGLSDFRDYTLPNAILRLKQGFGRLIRTKDDKGMVVILDPRIMTKSYGRQFLQSLPPCRMITEPEEM